MVPAHVWIHNDCTSVNELAEAAIVSRQIRQGVGLLIAELTAEKDRSERHGEDDEDVLLPELDGHLRFPGKWKRK